ncbi:hypothetical protein OG533_07495 [Streptomyces sp. NBC_01186]|uniref:DUF6571 family protein n=1 Tax=Streptomyces sp. NBC_01186 TaxID=2903765 RepID=UPI002E10D230|nr:hypothetical protein OG533_07495 [Streptomyces sp. NBC_01186]
MSVGYETIVNTDLGVLKTAAQAWTDMGDRYATLHGQYRDHVKAAVDSDSWQGLAAGSYRSQARVTLQEFAGARDEARAVGKLLDEAYRTLHQHKRHVERLRDQAEGVGMTVSATGHCTVDLASLDEDKAEAYARDHLAREEAERAWTGRIARAVKDTQDADHNLRLALKASPSDGDRGLPDGFNSALKGDAGAVNAGRATELYRKLAGGENLSAGELRELAFLARENGEDREYARTMLNSLGPAGTIEAANRLALLSHQGDAARRAVYGDLEGGLATSLATATRVPVFRDAAGKKLALGSEPYADRFRDWLHGRDGAFYRSWREGMRRVGVRAFDADAANETTDPQREVRGYQSLVTLMRRGDDYAPQLLFDLGDGIRAAEEKEPDLWDQERRYAGRHGGWSANDPMDGVLGLMSEDPPTAAAYLDPRSGGGNDRLDYLVNDRDWHVIDTSRFLDGAEVRDHDVADADTHSGFEAALEAGATGRAPGAEPEPSAHHSASNAGVMREAVRLFGSEPSLLQKDGDFQDLRPALGRMTADYPADVQRTMYRDDFPVAGARAGFSAGELHGFLGAVARDPHAYGAIAASQHAYTAGRLDSALGALPPGTDKSDAALEGQHAVRSGAKVLGILSEAKADALYEDKVVEVREFNERADEGSKWVNRLVGLGTGTALEPTAGGSAAATPVGWLQEDLNELVMEHIKKDAPSEFADSQEEAKHGFVSGGDQTVKSTKEMAEHAGADAGMEPNILKAASSAVAGQAGSSFAEGAGTERAHGSTEPID